MRAAHARLDVYSHHPYPVTRGERPWGFARNVCKYCKGVLTLANLPVLLQEVRRDFGPKRIWLTEYGYQTNPPDPSGVSRSVQAKYVAEAALRAKTARFVDLLIHFIIKDEPQLSGWQSGLFTAAGVAGPPSTRSSCRSWSPAGAACARRSGARCARARPAAGTGCSGSRAAAGSRSAIRPGRTSSAPTRA